MYPLCCDASWNAIRLANRCLGGFKSSSNTSRNLSACMAAVQEFHMTHLNFLYDLTGYARLQAETRSDSACCRSRDPLACAAQDEP